MSQLRAGQARFFRVILFQTMLPGLHPVFRTRYLSRTSVRMDKSVPYWSWPGRPRPSGPPSSFRGLDGGLPSPRQADGSGSSSALVEAYLPPSLSVIRYPQEHRGPSAPLANHRRVRMSTQRTRDVSRSIRYSYGYGSSLVSINTRV